MKRMRLTVPKTSLTSTDANSQDSAGKLQEDWEVLVTKLQKYISMEICKMKQLTEK